MRNAAAHASRHCHLQRCHGVRPSPGAALAKLAAAEAGDAGVDRAFLEAKLLSARFYYARILPRTLAHREGVLAGAESLMAMPAEAF